MGIIIRDGDGVQQDDALAILWFERAQELGHPDAAERLEEMRAQ
jgi:TPR repeat protein